MSKRSTIQSEFHRSRSILSTQRWVRRDMKKSPPFRNDILEWEQCFFEREEISSTEEVTEDQEQIKLRSKK